MTNARSRWTPLVLVLALTACGGGSSAASKAAPTTTEAARTTTTAKPTATTTEQPKADDATKAEAASRVFTEDDFPDGWSVEVEAPPYDRKGIKVDGCIAPEGGPISKLPLGAAASGPTMRAPDVDAFVSTWAATFADEAEADAYVEQITDPAFATCTAAALEEGGKDRKDFTAVVTSKDPEQAGVGQDDRVAANAYELREGDETLSIVYIDSYRIGRTVATVTLELGGMTQEQANAVTSVEADLRGQAFDG